MFYGFIIEKLLRNISLLVAQLDKTNGTDGEPNGARELSQMILELES